MSKGKWNYGAKATRCPLCNKFVVAFGFGRKNHLKACAKRYNAKGKVPDNPQHEIDVGRYIRLPMATK